MKLIVLAMIKFKLNAAFMKAAHMAENVIYSIMNSQRSLSFEDLEWSTKKLGYEPAVFREER